VHNLSKYVDFRVAMAAQAAGVTTPINGNIIDTLGWDAVVFVGIVGTLTATQVTVFKVQHGNDSGLSDAADVAGTAQSFADADSGKLVVSDIYHPKKRYMRPVFTRGTANAAINGVLAILYRGEVTPAAVHATAVRAAEVFNSPDSGTA
jgi:hypothetical protein